ncbi:MAG: SDR family NAD(P)-dependent oxidoreductase [Saprospiraceae bacterium]|nr:SDR family NAD(P)-dependent oxidoreductase [Saprospiraceae bacterium]
MESKVILITGGSSGIGFETARVFCSVGFDMIITSLDQDSLEIAVFKLKTEFPESDINGITIDLSIPGSAEKLYSEVQTISKTIHVVLNNAGFGTFGFINEISVDRETAMIRLMVENLYFITRLYLNDMIIRNEGTIINISSISAFQPNPALATYGACKAFVYQFSRAINTELKDKKSKVKCMVVCPTPVRTGFEENAGMSGTNLFNGWMALDAPFVANEIFKAYKSGKTYLIPGKRFEIIAAFAKRLPETIQIWLAKTNLTLK